MKTLAAVLYELNAPFVVEEVDLEGPGEGEILVEMAAGGVCHSDWHVVQGTIVKELPIILGHEGSARVLETGPGVTLVREGDPVVLSFLPECGRCRYCLSGQANLCDDGATWRGGTLKNGAIRFSKNGTPIRHFNAVSSFSQYAVVPQQAAVPIDPRLPLDRAALIGCAVSTGVGSVIFTARLVPGSTMAVFGAGGVGLNVIQGGEIAGASRIIAVDLLQSKLETARRFGATDLVNARDEDPVTAVLELTEGAGVDYAFEAIGLSETAEQALAVLGKGGTAVVIGIAPREALIRVPAQHLLYGERSLRGSFYGSTRPRLDFGRFADLYLRGKLRLDELVTREWKLTEINQAFEAMLDGEVARGIINQWN